MFGAEDDCNFDDKCSWCKCSAVPSACHSIENAKNLPAAVFQCSKIDEREVFMNWRNKQFKNAFDRFENMVDQFQKSRWFNNKVEDEDEDDEDDEEEQHFLGARGHGQW